MTLEKGSLHSGQLRGRGGRRMRCRLCLGLDLDLDLDLEGGVGDHAVDESDDEEVDEGETGGEFSDTD